MKRTHKITITTFLGLAVLQGALWMGTENVQGQVILNESFSSPVGGVPEDWVIRRKSGTTGVVTITEYATEDNRLLIRRPTTGEGGNSNSQGAVYYNGENATLSDYSGSVTISVNYSGASLAGSNFLGVALRAQNLAYEGYQGYYVAMTSGSLGVYYNPTNHVTATLLKSAAYTGGTTIAEGTDYQLNFSIIGSVISATLEDGNGVFANVSLDLSEEDYSGYTYYSEGYFGLRSGYGSSDMSGYYSDLQVTTVIPEPGIGVLLGLGYLAGGFRRRGKRNY